MRTSLRCRFGLVCLSLQVCLFTGVPASALAADKTRVPSAWPAVVIANAITHVAIESSLEGASQWLAADQCRSVLSEFHDQRGRPLTEKLEALGVDIQKFLRLVHFRDGTYESQCESGSTLAFTSPGSRVVWVCSRPFVAQWTTGRETAKAVVLHEVLHSLGLGENPPTSLEITSRILMRCAGRQSSVSRGR